MSFLIRLSTVAAIAVLLRCVFATVVITAPSTATGNTAGLETREQGPTAWICSALAVDSPWTSYANIRGYLEGGNAEKKDYSNLVLYPVMELFHASESRLCVYLPAEDHCYPPAPSTGQVKAVKQLSKRNYYAMRFWGQASDARVQYYRQKLTAALNVQSKAANFDLFFVSFFCDHVREVRYDPATTIQRKSADPLQTDTQRRPLNCPDVPGNSFSSTTMQVAGQKYFQTTLPGSRLNLRDVQTTNVGGSNKLSQDACARAAAGGGHSAFSFVSGACKVYDFGKAFCPCEPGDIGVYINTKLLGVSKELTSAKLEKGLKKMVVYAEIPPNQGFFPAMPFRFQEASRCVPNLGETIVFSGIFVVNNQCYSTVYHDLANCNQTCRGKPFDAFVNIVDPYPKTSILSLCGQKIVIPTIANARSISTYVSHDGIGCYRYQEAKTAGEEDCMVTFEKDIKTKPMEFTLIKINLNSEGNTCLDVLSIYDGNTTANASKIYNGCSENRTKVFSGAGITIKFHRGRQSSEKNSGFIMFAGNYFW